MSCCRRPQLRGMDSCGKKGLNDWALGGVACCFLGFRVYCLGLWSLQGFGITEGSGALLFSEGIALEVRSKGSFRFRDSCSEGPLERGPT